MHTSCSSYPNLCTSSLHEKVQLMTFRANKLTSSSMFLQSMLPDYFETHFSCNTLKPMILNIKSYKTFIFSFQFLLMTFTRVRFITKKGLPIRCQHTHYTLSCSVVFEDIDVERWSKKTTIPEPMWPITDRQPFF